MPDCSSVVPWTVMFDVPEPHGGRSTVTTTSVDVRGRKSATPDAAGNVVRSMTVKRRRVMLPPVLLVKVRRMSSVPNVELLGASGVVSRTRFGAALATEQVSSRLVAITSLRSIGDDRLRGLAAPRRCPSPADVPLESTKIKSVALLFVSIGLKFGHRVKDEGELISPCLPHSSRTKAWSI